MQERGRREVINISCIKYIAVRYGYPGARSIKPYLRTGALSVKKDLNNKIWMSMNNHTHKKKKKKERRIL